jgi:hypothetical protein
MTALTPQLATNLLSTTLGQLAFDAERIRQLVNAMRDGTFRPGSVIWVDGVGTLLDGRHRCAAVLVTGAAAFAPVLCSCCALILNPWTSR